METFLHVSPTSGYALMWVCLLVLAYVTVGDAKDRACDKYALAPGVDKFSWGVDITTFDLLPLSGHRDQKLRHPIFKFTCNEEKYWSLGKTTFDLPDQIATIVTVPGGTANLETSLRKTSKQLREYMNINTGIEGSFGAFSFSASASYRKNEESINKKSRFTQDVHSYTSSTRAEFLPYYKLENFMSSHAQKQLAKMIKPYTEDPSEYNKFIAKYGTHYIHQGNLGGVLKLYLETSSSYYRGKSDTEISAQAEASFGAFFSARVGLKTTTNTVSESFNSSTTYSIRYYGGSENLLETNGWQSWQPSVPLNPWLFKCQLKPISDLITDEEKKSNLELATEQYVLRKYLKSLKRKIYLLKQKYPKAKLIPAIAERLDDQGRRELISGDALKTLSEQMESKSLTQTPTRPVYTRG